MNAEAPRLSSMPNNVIKAQGERNEIVIVNSSDRDWTRHRYILWFGACSPTYLMVWANGLESALDEAIDWLDEHEPGQLCDDEVAEEYQRCIAAGLSEEEAQERAEIDTTCGGNAGQYVNSDEWGIVCEDPSREQILSFLRD